MNSQLIQLLVLAGIAVFLILKLRSVLGTRDGFEKPPLPLDDAKPVARRDFAVIDWQYAAFVTPRADWLLEYLAAYFIRMAPAEARAPLIADWLPALHRRADHPLAYPAFAGRVDRLLATRPSTRARLGLRPVA